MSKNFNETLDVGNSDGDNVLSLQMKTSEPSVTGNICIPGTFQIQMRETEKD